MAARFDGEEFDRGGLRVPSAFERRGIVGDVVAVRKGALRDSVRYLMFAAGDAPDSDPEAVEAMEAIVHEHLAGMTTKVLDFSARTGARVNEQAVIAVLGDETARAVVRERLAVEDEDRPPPPHLPKMDDYRAVKAARSSTASASAASGGGVGGVGVGVGVGVGGVAGSDGVAAPFPHSMMAFLSAVARPPVVPGR